MGVDIFSINLDNPVQQYSPGHMVSGKLLIRISEVETTTEIIIRFFGIAHTHWTEQEYHHHRHNSINAHFGHSHTSIHNIDYEATEGLFEYPVRLFGDGQNRRQIPPGDNVFPFAFQIPAKSLPVNCSFEDGHVRYGVEGRIRKPWYTFDHKTDILPITIFTPIDLNLSPGAVQPFQAVETRLLGCCCSEEACSIHSYSPRCGFCVGEQVPLIAEIRNMSSQPILFITATLEQVWTLHADNGSRGRHTRSHSVDLQTLGHPGYGSLEYVHVELEGSCCSSNVNLSHPLMVGNVPIRVLTAVVTNEIPKYKENGGLA